jgi:hypothetical protein
MSWPPPPDDAQRFLGEINAGDADRINAFTAGLQAEHGTIDACRQYAAAVTKPLAGGELDAQPRDESGASAVVKVLSQHPAFAEERDLPYAEAVFGPQGTDPAEVDARREVSEFIAVGLSALASEDALDKRSAWALVTVAIGADALSRFVRDVVLGLDPRGFDFDLNGLIPPHLIDREKLDRLGCVQGIQGAALGLGLGVQAARAWATGITALDPPAGCADDTVVIRGSGFGSTQPNGVVVMFPGNAGRCVEAQVTAWSDTAVTVVVPDGVGAGCVGFAQAGTPADFEAASTFAGELERCIGPAAFRVTEKIRRFGGVAPPPPCPDCLTGGANRFGGGTPVIDMFTANLGHDVAVEPNDHVVLRWSVQNAQTLTLIRMSQQGPFAPPPVPLPASGSLDLGPFTGSSPVTAIYQLTASNGCGSEPRVVVVRLIRVPKLAVDAIEVVQVIQMPDNSVRLVSHKRTVARVFVDSGVVDGFNYGQGPNVVPGIVGNVVVYPQGRGFGTSGTPVTTGGALAVPAMSRSRANPLHSFDVELPIAELDGQVRIEAQVWVAGHEADVGGPWRASTSTTVDFHPQPSQEVLPILLTDGLNGLPAPTLAAWNTSLQEARKRYPLAETGFRINPPLTLPASNPFGSPYDLSKPGDWGFLLNDIRTIAFVFPSTPVGGIRTAMVPRNGGGLLDAAGNRIPPLTDAAGNPIPPYAVNGMGQARSAGIAPGFICQAELAGTNPHEMGHTFALGHAPCPAPPGTPGTLDCKDPPVGIDSRLPGTTDEVGYDVPAGVVIENGRGELMSYCGDLSRCPGATRWPSIVTWDLLFDHLPVS